MSNLQKKLRVHGSLNVALSIQPHPNRVLLMHQTPEQLVSKLSRHTSCTKVTPPCLYWCTYSTTASRKQLDFAVLRQTFVVRYFPIYPWIDVKERQFEYTELGNFGIHPPEQFENGCVFNLNQFFRV